MADGCGFGGQELTLGGGQVWQVVDWTGEGDRRGEDGGFVSILYKFIFYSGPCLFSLM